MTNEFETLERYLLALEENPAALAILPITEVAKLKKVTRAAIDRKLRLSQLDTIKIGKTRYVAAASLLRNEAEETGDLKQVQAILESSARAGVERLFYSDVMTPIGMQTKVPAHRMRIGQLLGDLSKLTYRDNGILLSVLVHTRRPGKTRPGPGFFELVDLLAKDNPGDTDLLYELDDRDSFVQEHTLKVLRHYQT